MLRIFQTGLRVLATVSLLGAAHFGGEAAAARDRRPSKEERRIAALRERLESKDPREYCEAVLTFRPNGFFPYCSPVTYPGIEHAFTTAAAIQGFKSVLVQTRLEDDRVISARATPREKALIDEAGTAPVTVSQFGCLEQSPAACIAFLSSRFLVTTALNIPFYDWSSQASFDPEKARSRTLNLQLVVRRSDTSSLVRSFGWNDMSPVYDVIGLGFYVMDDKINSVTITGRYPILSDNPEQYRNSGFAAFMKDIFPGCPIADEDDFYRSFWDAMVRRQTFTPSSGRWTVTRNGLSNAHTSSSEGLVCGLRSSSFNSAGRHLTDQGRMLRSSTQQITLRLPR